MKPESGWHGYWTNPGAAGLPVEADWDLPTGVTVSSLRHPAPHLLDVQGIASYVHDGPFTLLATMKVPQSLAPGTALPVEVALSWLVCSDTLCVPERATLSANLEVGSGAPRSEEHTSELQSLMRNSYAAFCMQKKKHTITSTHTIIIQK